MKRILKSILEIAETAILLIGCIACPPVFIHAINKVYEDNNHEKTIANPYATYLCISSNGPRLSSQHHD
jgi:hypothetical protein